MSRFRPKRGYPAPQTTEEALRAIKLPDGPAPGAPTKARTADVRATLDELRAYVAKVRVEHDPACPCEWDRGAMWVIEAVEAVIH